MPQREAPNFTPTTALESFTVHLKTITPMFGGGAETRKANEQNPVRAASVRGHLRFWWRATAGAGYASAKALYEAESEIWGSTEGAGKVRVEVTEQKASAPYFPSLPRYMSYATFPFQEQRAKGIEAARAIDVEFKVKITCPPELRPQVETALHAWIFFGGIGSRTRRGCGSLELVGGEAKPPKAVSKGERLLTALPQVYFLSRAQNDAVKAWAEAVALYRDFRQGVHMGRNEGRERNRPGRSRYPEPDTLRDITRQYGHQTIHPVRGFPRANLGLPIIFHFQGQGEPSDQTLQGKVTGKQRFASPVITKAVKVGGQWRPLLALLQSPDVWEGGEIELKGGHTITTSEINLSPKELAQIKPLAGLPIRDALLDFAREEGWQGVNL
ncbi:type III-B CRISPR module RAMP protein Cmr1 [Deinococcus piscis]|uniref:Type III-B CRISPR module RAMP protein Cmr1 n=1 Tax=Deinococcus piscis TaxID=394230 RepID=A0ABQ3KCR3_9DEIO|nr:type III-B CRISPR module RAMP protein Cmr1 [Deinococcus piscis]GHG09736.1 type III-B CRISPR module RAMP protein Cmr1 [Deinococcus piscis]